MLGSDIVYSKLRFRLLSYYKLLRLALAQLLYSYFNFFAIVSKMRYSMPPFVNLPLSTSMVMVEQGG